MLTEKIALQTVLYESKKKAAQFFNLQDKDVATRWIGLQWIGVNRLEVE